MRFVLPVHAEFTILEDMLVHFSNKALPNLLMFVQAMVESVLRETVLEVSLIVAFRTIFHLIICNKTIQFVLLGVLM